MRLMQGQFDKWIEARRTMMQREAQGRMTMQLVTEMQRVSYFSNEFVKGNLTTNQYSAFKFFFPNFAWF